MLKLLIYGVPGTPVFEIGERLSEFHELNYYTIEKVPESHDSYFDDKIPEVSFDTGDFMNGSESQHMVRDPGSLRLDKELSDADASIPDAGEYEDCLIIEELACIFDIKQGVVSTEIPDRKLVEWATHVLFLQADEKKVVSWFNKRRFCPVCETVYHLEEKVPIVLHRCDRCGTDLIQQEKDQPQEIRDQFKAWRNAFWKFEETAKQQGKFKIVNIDKCRDFSDVISRVNLWVRNEIEYQVDSWWEVAQTGI